MKRFVDVLILVVLIGVGSSFAHAQDFEYKLVSAGGEEYSHIALVRLSNDTLYFLQNINYADWIQIDSIAQLRHERRSAILPAAIIGAVGGGTLGFSVKPVAKNQEEANVYGAAFGAVIGGVTGFFVGSLIQSDEVFDFGELSRQAKIDRLTTLVHNH